MQEKHAPQKETDITKPLVVTFIVLLALLLTVLMNKSTASKLSTSSRAAKPAASSEQSQWCKNNMPLNGDFGRTKSVSYNGSGDFCAGPMTVCGDTGDTSLARDKTDSFLAMSNKDKNKCGYGLDKWLYNCCRKTTQTPALGDNLCQNEFANTNARCLTGSTAQKTCSATYGASAKTNIKCAKTEQDNLKSNWLVEGYCCNIPFSTAQTDCGKKHINCDKFNVTVDGVSKNTNAAGAAVYAKCMPLSNGSDAICANDGATIAVGNNIRCDGRQYADKVYGQYGCFTTAKDGYPSASKDSNGVEHFFCAYSEVSLGAGETCKSKIPQ